MSYLLCAGEKSVKGTSPVQHLSILGGFCSEDWHSSACSHQRDLVGSVVSHRFPQWYLG